MNIALIGYGKMGKAIEKIAEERGHKIVLICNSELSVQHADFSNVEMAIEFSQPNLAMNHIDFCLSKNIPVIVGTTGWNEHLSVVQEKIKATNGSLLHASNFSIGVNIFFELNKKLAQLLEGKMEYKASIEEIHHLQKLDSPSGTAITIADGILANNNDYNFQYTSKIDTISISHEAHSRIGFALGAVIAAEFLLGKKGEFQMNDVLNF